MAGRLVFVMALVGLLVGTQGCYHYRVVAAEADLEPDVYEKTVHTYVWGLVNTQKDAVISNEAGPNPGDCPKDYGLYDVRVTRNLGHMLATSITLGIWAPLKVEWRCTKKPSDEGDPISFD